MGREWQAQCTYWLESHFCSCCCSKLNKSRQCCKGGGVHQEYVWPIIAPPPPIPELVLHSILFQWGNQIYVYSLLPKENGTCSASLQWKSHLDQLLTPDSHKKSRTHFPSSASASTGDHVDSGEWQLGLLEKTAAPVQICL